MSVAALMKEVSIRFAVYYTPEEFRTVIDAFASGTIDPGPLVGATMGLGIARRGLRRAGGRFDVGQDPDSAVVAQDLRAPGRHGHDVLSRR